MRRWDLLGLSLGALAGLTLAGGSALARRVFPRDGTLDFLALRHERVVGRQRLCFSRKTGDFTVRRGLEIAFERSGIPVYRFLHQSQDTWADG